jgi:dsDNA-binding SOS-regulon protein
MEKKSTTAKRSPDGSGVAIEDDERHSDEVGEFLARNRDTLNRSIKRSRAEVAKGKVSSKSIDDIIAEGRKQFSAKR